MIPSQCQGALYDLNVFLVLRNEGWRLACEYNTDLFEAKTITGLLNNYRTTLENIAENPNRKLSEFPVLEGTKNCRAESIKAIPSSGASGPGTPPLPRSLGAAGVSAVAMPPPEVPAVRVPEEPVLQSYMMPASVAQRRFWTLEEFAPGNPALHMRACVRLSGPVSLPLLEKSLRLLVTRHEILRTTFDKVNEDLVQVITPVAKISLPLTPIEGATETEREEKLKDAIRTEVRSKLDLVRGPLIRGRLFSLQPQEHVLVVTTHHILVDGWSQGVIQRDLWTIYDALTQHREPSLPPLSIQYSDFVHWQQQWLTSGEAQEQLDFWKSQLVPPPPVLKFPVEKPGKRSATSEPLETLLLPPDLVQELKTLSQSEDVTVFMLLLAGFAALLSRYTDQQDILLGSPVAHRGPETESLIGPFASPVSLRLKLSENPTLRELLTRAREVTVEALSHADLPFEVLLEKLEARSFCGAGILCRSVISFIRMHFYNRERWASSYRNTSSRLRLRVAFRSANGDIGTPRGNSSPTGIQPRNPLSPRAIRCHAGRLPENSGRHAGEPGREDQPAGNFRGAPVPIDGCNRLFHGRNCASPKRNRKATKEDLGRSSRLAIHWHAAKLF